MSRSLLEMAGLLRPYCDRDVLTATQTTRSEWKKREKAARVAKEREEKKVPTYGGLPKTSKSNKTHHLHAP